VSGLRFLDPASSQDRSRHAGIEYGVTARLEPGAQQRNVSRAADAVGTLDDDQLAAVLDWSNAG
jgi:hypothetical protein